MRTDDFDFTLPETLIAQFPATERRSSRLLKLNGNSHLLEDCLFYQLPDFLSPGDVLVFNDTRVIKARLSGQKMSGGKVEVLIERIISEHEAICQIKASKSPKPGTQLEFTDAITATVIGRDDDLFHVRFDSDTSVSTLLEMIGTLPLPPYIQHAPGLFDENRYQTVYARVPGAVAAPTAGLHFDNIMLDELRQRGVIICYVTLHVGAGTFQPVRTEYIAGHKMHREHYEITPETAAIIQQAQTTGSRITAVGTTALRALESAARSGKLIAGKGDTDIFITPGFKFQIVQRLLTNFHLPKSTLLMLVSAFAGMQNIRQAYQHAIAQQYRFFSYGDAMLIERQD